MKRTRVFLLLALAVPPNFASAQATDPELKELVRKIADHSIRLEEQNRATQKQLALIERQMDKRFTMMQDNMDKRFDQVDKRIALVGWVVGGLVTAVLGGIVYLMTTLSRMAVVEKHLEDKNRHDRLHATQEDCGSDQGSARKQG